MIDLLEQGAQGSPPGRVARDGPPDMGQPPVAPTPPIPPGIPGQQGIENISVRTGPDGERIISVLDEAGKVRTIKFDKGVLTATTSDGRTTSVGINELIPNQAVDMVQALGATLVLSILMIPVSRAIARLIDRRSVAPHVPRDVVKRMEHIEQQLDSVAIEIERVSEAQRFASKILAGNAGEMAVPRRAEAVPVGRTPVPG